MAYTYKLDKKSEARNRSLDRILVLELIDAKKPRSSTGQIDTRIFTGDNNLHAVNNDGLWFLRYDHGAIPEPLKQRFTNFSMLIKRVNTYLETRNLRLKEIQD